MTESATPAPEAQSKTAYNSVAGLLGDWIRQGTEGFVAAQKVFLDVAAQQNALALSIVRDRVGFSPPPAKKVADFTGQHVRTMLDMQRQALDLVLKQNSILQAGLVTRLAKTPLGGVTEVLHKSLEHFIATQKQLLDAVQTQTEGALQDFADGRPFNSGRLPELGREAVNRFLEGQKQILSVVQERIAESKDEPTESAVEALAVVEMAKQSVDALVETQQKLLDIISEQVKVTETFAREVFTSDVNRATFSDVVKKSMESFTAAQKALVDLAAKPREKDDAGKAAAA